MCCNRPLAQALDARSGRARLSRRRAAARSHCTGSATAEPTAGVFTYYSCGRTAASSPNTDNEGNDHCVRCLQPSSKIAAV